MRTFSRRLSVGMTGIALALAGVVVGLPSAPASAVTTGNVLSGTASPMWQTNNTVSAVLVSGNTIYAGGQFTQVRPPGTAINSGQRVTRNYLAAFNATTGALITGFNANVGGGQVKALAMSADGARLYIGGAFRTVGGQTRNRVAAVNPTTGAVTSFNPNAGATVNALAVSPNAVYVGGAFGRIGGVNQGYLASVNPTTGAVNTGFAPIMRARPNGSTPSVTALATDAAGLSLLVGGNFWGTNDNNGAGGMASLHPTTGATRPWAANSVQPINTNCDGRVSDFVITGGTAYVTAEGDPPGCYEGTYAANLSDGALIWNSSCLGASQAIGVLNGVLFKGSHNHDCAFDRGGAFSGFVGGTNRNTFIHRHLGGQDVTDGSFVHWSPDTNGAGSQPVGPRALDTGTLPGGVGTVVVGGDFTRVNDTAQQGLARFVTGGDNATPDVPGRIINGDRWTGTPIAVAMRMPVTVQPTGAGTLTVEFPASDDADTGVLSYRIYRDGDSTPIATLSAESYPWSRPVLRYDDTGLAPGSTHSYRVSASDGPRTSARSAAVSGTVANAAPPSLATAYSSRDPFLWWRLDDIGTTAADSSGHARPGTLVGGVTTGSPGPGAGNNAVTLDGTSGYVTSTEPITIAARSPFTETAWFKTTSTTGGVIVAQSDRQTGTAQGSNTDRMISMDNNGGILFAIKSGRSSPFGVGTINIRNQGPVWNDGKWHQVVGTYDGNGGAALYVDGWLQGTAQGTPFDATGVDNGISPSYLRAGYADMSGIQVRFGINFYNNPWPLSPYFNGSLDEVAAFDHALTSEQVQQMFAAGVAGEDPEVEPPAAPTAEFTPTTNGLTASFANQSTDLDGDITSYSWDFGDGIGSSTSTNPSYTYDATGEYDVTLTARDSGGRTDSVTKTVSVSDSPGPPTETTVVANGSSWSWRYASGAPDANWNTPGFDASGWAVGEAVFGWGTPVSTSLDIYPDHSDRPRAAYFTKTFQIADASHAVNLRLSTVANDGIVVYVNGTEVTRANMPNGTITSQTFASTARNTNTANSDPVVVDVPASLLVDGTNVISAETHVNYRNTRDVTFDLEGVLTTN